MDLVHTVGSWPLLLASGSPFKNGRATLTALQDADREVIVPMFLAASGQW